MRYCLYNIERNKNNKFVYTFISEKRKSFKEEFNTVGEAEKLIADLSGETIPDYAAFHARKI